MIACLAKLYTPVPAAVGRYYRGATSTSKRDTASELRAEDARLRAILADPRASDDDKRIARLDLYAIEMLGKVMMVSERGEISGEVASQSSRAAGIAANDARGSRSSRGPRTSGHGGAR